MFRIQPFTIVLFCLLIFPFIILEAQNKKKCDSLISIIKSGANDTSRVNAMIELSAENKTYLRTSFIDSAYRLSIRSKYQKGVARLLNTYGIIKWQKGNLDSALYFFSQSYQMSQKNHLAYMAFRSANNIGILYLNLSKSDSAEYYLKKAYQLYKPSYDKKNFAKLNIDMGNFYNSTSKYHNAHQHFLNAKTIYEQLNDTTNLVSVYISLGILYYNLGNFETSVANYYKVISIATRWKISPYFVATTYNNLGLTYMNLKRDLLLADYYFKKSIRISEENNLPRLKMGAEVNAAIIHYERGEFRKTIQLNNDIMERYTGQLSDLQRSALLINTGLAYNKLGEYHKALEPLRGGIELASRIKNYEFVSKAYRSKYTTDSIQGNFREALVNYKKHIQFRDSVTNADIVKTISEQEVRFALQKKENELLLANSREQLAQKTISSQKTFIYFIVALALLLLGLILLGSAFYIKLKRLNHQLFLNQKKLEDSQELIGQKNLELEKTNQTKDRFFSIIAHDLRMPFTSILGFMDLLTQEFDRFDQKRIQEIHASLRKTSYNTYELLENLLDWSKSQRKQITVHHEKTSIKSITDEILNLLSPKIQSKSLTIHNQIPDDFQLWVDPKLTENALLNIINNAVKFTPPGGKIKLFAELTDNHGIIRIQDNGIGIPENKIDKLFEIDSDYKRPGTDGEPGTGLGLILCAEYITLMNGQIWVESNPGKGSTFSVRLPK